jgi:FKBP-type peptidyl-prolyl cis-trans isomerase FkpA
VPRSTLQLWHICCGRDPRARDLPKLRLAHRLRARKHAWPESELERFMTTNSLQIDNLKEGAGDEALAGKTVSVHYVGTLTDGSTFDSSRTRGKPFAFKLGAGQVIAGWDQGVTGMRVGGLRKLTIPPDLGYGARGFPPVIPANSTLVFEVELLGVG